MGAAAGQTGGRERRRSPAASAGRTFSLIESEPDPAAVCDAIRQQRVSVRTEPLTTSQVASHLVDLLAADARNACRRVSLRLTGERGRVRRFAAAPQRRSRPADRPLAAPLYHLARIMRAGGRLARTIPL